MGRGGTEAARVRIEGASRWDQEQASARRGGVNDGEAAAAVSLHHTTIDQLLSVADAGLIMPPKSTWFEPKLRSGLFVHSLD